MHDELDERCTRIRILMAESRERALRSDEEVERDTHLSECEECRAAASWLELADEMARSAPSPSELSEARLEFLVSAVMDRIGDEAPSRPKRHGWVWAPTFASVAAVAVVAFVLLRSPESTQQMLPPTEPVMEEKLERLGSSYREDSGARDELAEIELTQDPKLNPAGALDKESELRQEGSDGRARVANEPEADAPEANALAAPETVDERVARAPIKRDQAPPTSKLSKPEPSTPAPSASTLSAPAEEEAAGKSGRSPEALTTQSPQARGDADELSLADEPSLDDQLSLADEPSLLEALGEKEPQNAASADSLRSRLLTRLESTTVPASRDSLETALEELEMLWPQGPDSD